MSLFHFWLGMKYQEKQKSDRARFLRNKREFDARWNQAPVDFKIILFVTLLIFVVFIFSYGYLRSEFLN